MSKTDNIIGLKVRKQLHPVLEQALYVVPRCIQRDAWWLIKEPAHKQKEIK